MLFSNVFFIRFERFAHHVVSYFSVLVCYQEPNIFCVMYIAPLFLNSLHWLPIGLQNEFLYIYNVSIIIFSILTFYTSYNRRVKLLSARIFIVSGLLYNVNVFGYAYGFRVNIFDLNYEKAVYSFWFSLVTSSPLYGYLIYINCDNLNFFRKKID